MINVRKMKTSATLNKMGEDYNAYKRYRSKTYNAVELVKYKKNSIGAFYSESSINNPETITNADSITIIHHTDLDGDASGSIAYNYSKNILEKAGKTAKFSFLRYNYKIMELVSFINEIKRTTDSGTRLAIIVDLSLPMDSLERMLEVFDKVIWIDHHGTSLKVAEDIATNPDYRKKISFAIDKSNSATYMAYLLFCEGLFDGNDNEWARNSFPALIISDYDTWNNGNVIRYTLGTYLNQYYYSLGTLTASHDYWKQLFCNKESDSALAESLTYGKKLVSIDQLKNDVLYNATCKYFYVEANYSICVINGTGNSSRFSSMDENDIKILLRINTDNTITASLFSENLTVQSMDLGRICREHFNGGGHPGAAGFSYDIESFFSHVNEIVRVKEGYPEGSKINYNDDVAKISDALAALVFYELRKELKINK